MDLPVSLLDGFGTVAVVVLFSWLIAAGRLSTKGEVTRTTALYTLRIADLEHERDEWKTAALASKAQVDTLLPALAAVRDGQQTILTFIEALPKDGRS